MDILDSLDSTVITCLDHGHVQLVDISPRLVTNDKPNADYRIIDAARQSYIGSKSKSKEEDRGLIRYLMRNNHTTPFEMVEFVFHHKLPIFVARQLIRHRTASVNEASGRYSQLPNDFYIPTSGEVRGQSKTNKQGSEGVVEELNARNFSLWCEENARQTYSLYEEGLKNGIAKEMARINLPVSIYTEWYWKIDLKNLLGFLALRCDSHAQAEIRVYADAMLNLIRPLLPWTIEAWEDFHPYRGAILLTALEVEAMQKHSISLSERATKREQQEWQEKREKLDIYDPT